MRYLSTNGFEPTVFQQFFYGFSRFQTTDFQRFFMVFGLEPHRTGGSITVSIRKFSNLNRTTILKSMVSVRVNSHDSGWKPAGYSFTVNHRNRKLWAPLSLASPVKDDSHDIQVLDLGKVSISANNSAHKPCFPTLTQAHLPTLCLGTRQLASSFLVVGLVFETF